MKPVSAQAECCFTYVKPKTYIRAHSIVVWLLGQSSCSSPSTKELHGVVPDDKKLQNIFSLNDQNKEIKALMKNSKIASLIISLTFRVLNDAKYLPTTTTTTTTMMIYFCSKVQFFRRVRFLEVVFWKTSFENSFFLQGKIYVWNLISAAESSVSK